jgi:hypothetical protein
MLQTFQAKKREGGVLMRKPTLEQVKSVVCRDCCLKGHCREDVKCNLIKKIEKFFKVRL